jgi:WD40 repeat protein/transcriptional regulator with XRE-family HTH domain
MPVQDSPGPDGTRSQQAAGMSPTAGQSPVSARPDLIRRPDPLTVSTPTEFAHAFAALREQAGVSIRDLARGVGATSNTIGAYFSGRRLPPVSATATVEKLLAACGVPAGPTRQAWLDALSRVRRLPGARPTDVPVPYRGLDSYNTEDSSFFFGREKLVARLVALVTTAAGAGPTLLVGPSGSGKTSALHAGLAARLRTAGNWEVFSFTPGARPLKSLEAALQSVRERKLPPGSRVAVIIDQFEELFTLCPHEDQRQTFIDQVTAPLQPGPGIGPAVTVVIALRADFYGAALRHGALSLALQDRQVVVCPMAEADLRRAITEPARAAGAQIDPGLVELVLHDMAPTSLSGDAAAGGKQPAHEAGTLPLMSYALLQTWQRVHSNRLTVEDYVAAGGISAAVSTAAESVFAELTPTQQELTRQLFLRLVVVDDTAANVRRRATARELGLDVPEGDATSEVLERFVTARLLTTTETTVEIAHEALLAVWPRLRGWLDTEQAGIVTRRRLVDAARVWKRNDREQGVLHRGASLISAREWAADPMHAGKLEADEQAFLDASVAALERDQNLARRRARRTQTLLVGVSLLAAVASGLSTKAFLDRSSAEHDRNVARSLQLAETANRLRGTDPWAAGQFAALAWRTAQTPETRSALLSTSAMPIGRRLDGPGGSATVAASGNGRVMAAAGERGGLRIWTLGRQATPVPTQVSTLSGIDGRGLSTLALNREGTVLVAGGASGVLRAWDLSTPSSPVSLPSAPTTRSGILKLAFSADGRTLAVATGDNRILLYNVQPGRGTATLTALGAPLQGSAKGITIQTIAISSDGRALAAGSGNKVQLWTLTDRNHPQPVPVQLTGAGGSITSLAFSPDGHRLVAASKDKNTYGWLLATPTASPQRYEGASDGVNAVTFSPDNTYIVTGATDHHLRIYDAATRALTADLPHPGPVTAVAFLPNGRTLVTGSADGTVRLWPAPGPTTGMPTEHARQLAYLAGARLGVTTSRDNLQIFDVSQRYRPRPMGLAVEAPNAPGSGRTAGFSGAIAANRSGTLIAAGGTNGTAWLYRTGNGTAADPSAQLVGTVPRLHHGTLVSVALSPDGTTLVTGGDDGTVRVTDVSNPGSPRLLGSPLTGAGVANSLVFGPDGTTLAAGTANPNTVTFWNLGDREHPRRIGQPLTGPAAPVSSVAFSPDGHTLAIGSTDGTVLLADTSDRNRLGWLGTPLLSSGNDVTGVSFAPDGRTIAAAGTDGVVRLWDVSNRTDPDFLAALLAGRPLRAVTFDRTPGRLAATGEAQTVWQWDLDPDTASARVCELAGTPMSQQEWARYLPGIDYTQPCQG